MRPLSWGAQRENVTKTKEDKLLQKDINKNRDWKTKEYKLVA